jgi:hypothetical protein
MLDGYPDRFTETGMTKMNDCISVNMLSCNFVNATAPIGCIGQNKDLSVYLLSQAIGNIVTKYEQIIRKLQTNLKEKKRMWQGQSTPNII